MLRVHLSDMDIQLGDYLVSLFYIGSDEPPKVWSVHPHSHAFFELHTVSRGRGRLMTKSGVFEIGPGTTYLTGPEFITANTPRAMRRWMSGRCVF